MCPWGILNALCPNLPVIIFSMVDNSPHSNKHSPLRLPTNRSPEMHEQALTAKVEFISKTTFMADQPHLLRYIGLKWKVSGRSNPELRTQFSPVRFQSRKGHYPDTVALDVWHLW